MIEIIRYPSTTDNSNICKFSAAGNPLYFEVSRKDHTITASGAYSGFLQLFIADTSAFTLSESVYVVGKDVSSNIIISKKSTIFFIAASYIVLTDPATNPTNQITQGWVNQLSDTKREIEVTGVLNYDLSNSVSVVARRFSYDAAGTVKVYINQILKDAFVKRYDVTLTGVNLVDKAAFEMELDFEDIESGDDTSTTGYYGVKAVRQLPDDNRMIEYEVYSYGTTFSTAKFLSAFARPVIFNGYPFHLYALMGRNDDAVYFRNTNPRDAYVDTLFDSQDKGVWSMRVQQQGVERSLTAQLVTNVTSAQQFLDIDEADHQLDIGGGVNLRIQ